MSSPVFTIQFQEIFSDQSKRVFFFRVRIVDNVMLAIIFSFGHNLFIITKSYTISLYKLSSFFFLQLFLIFTSLFH